MLTAKPNVNLRFMFEYLSYLELKSEEHKRHYISEIASLVVELPSKEMQNKIASLMTSLDNKLALEENTSVRYEDEKQYLLANVYMNICESKYCSCFVYSVSKLLCTVHSLCNTLKTMDILFCSSNLGRRI